MSKPICLLLERKSFICGRECGCVSENKTMTSATISLSGHQPVLAPLKATKWFLRGHEDARDNAQRQIPYDMGNIREILMKLYPRLVMIRFLVFQNNIFLVWFVEEIGLSKVSPKEISNRAAEQIDNLYHEHCYSKYGLYHCLYYILEVELR